MKIHTANKRESGKMILDTVSPEEAQKNTETLEDLYLSADIQTLPVNWFEMTEDVAIFTLARYGNRALLADIVETAELDPTGEYDSMLISVMAEIYALWVDKDALVARADNQLAEPATDNWQDTLNHRLAKLLIKKGSLMGFRRSIYGWHDVYGQELPEIVGVFNVREDRWEEFTGTFATDNDSRTGITGHVLYANGLMRDFRYEGNLSDIMQEIV